MDGYLNWCWLNDENYRGGAEKLLDKSFHQLHVACTSSAPEKVLTLKRVDLWADADEARAPTGGGVPFCSRAHL